jgi:Gpi18-like mannosyltransferase
MISKSDLKFIIGLVLIWWFSLASFSFFSQSFLPKIVNGQLTHPGSQPLNLISSWAGWDGGHFLGIAQSGYLYPFQYAFFPLFPLLIKIFSPLFAGNLLASGLILSNFCLFLALVFLFLLARLDFNLDTSRKALFFLLIFPTSFFLAALYSESLFLALVISSFYFARRQNWFIASSLAALASATRALGILLFFVLLFEYFYQKKFKLKLDLNFFSIFISPLGLFSWLLYLKFATGNPWIFLEAQGYWQRVATFPWQTLSSYASFIFGINQVGTPAYAQIVLEFSSAVIFLLLLIFSSLRIRASYLLFGFLYLFATFSTGNLLSQPRLALAIFPAFLTLAVWAQNKIFDIFLTIFSLLSLALFLSMFLAGFWIA